MTLRSSRSTIATLVLLCVAALAACTTAPAVETPPPVTTAAGQVQGAVDDDLLRYSGIPYAAAPVGDLRWAPPAAVAPWDGVREATSHEARCPQPPAQLGAPAETPGSDDEDCLSLSVTTPAEVNEGEFPVIVWIHGGGFATGAGQDHDPAALARAGAVVVTINYRLGVLGFLDLPGLEHGGTFGLLDQQAALAWVQDNITAFGGDPDRVTIAGNSAGADSVCAHLSSPSAAGLFGAAILQSPGCGQVNVTDGILPGAGPAADTWKPPEVSAELGAAFLAMAGCDDADTPLDCLREIDAAALLEAEAAGEVPIFWSPTHGTEVLPRRPSDAIADGAYQAVPVLISSVQDEGAFFVGPVYAGTPLDTTGLTELVGLVAPEGAGEETVLQTYHQDGASPNRTWASIVSDRVFSCPTIETAVSLGEHEQVYLAEFTDPNASNVFSVLPDDLTGTATHGSDVPYVLDLTPGQPELDRDQAALSAALQSAWVAFAAEHDPSTADFAWRSFSDQGVVANLTSGGPEQTSLATLDAAHHCDIWTP